MSCRICLEVLNQPASLPCGHIFCTQCIVRTVQAIKPWTHIHPCPICRLPYNIAPLDIRNVPLNLRPFMTPSIRKVFINTTPENKEEKTSSSSSASIASSPSFSPKMSSGTSEVSGSQPSPNAPSAATVCARNFDTTSEIARLRAENDALRNHCTMWRRRAEIHGEANLGLLKFARAMRDQMVLISRDRTELEERCFLLKKMLDGDCDYEEEMSRYRSGKDKAARDNAEEDTTPGPDRGTPVLPPLIPFANSTGAGPCIGLNAKRPRLEDDEDDLEGPRKKLRLDDLLATPEDVGITIPSVDAASRQVPSYLEGRRRSV